MKIEKVVFVIGLLLFLHVSGGIGIAELSAQSKSRDGCVLDIKAKSSGVVVASGECKLILAKKASNGRQAEAVVRSESGEVRVGGVPQKLEGSLLKPEQLLSYAGLRKDRQKGNPCRAEGESGKKLFLPIPCGPEEVPHPVLIHACGEEMPPFYITALCYSNWSMNGSKIASFDDLLNFGRGTGNILPDYFGEAAFTYKDTNGDGLTTLLSVPNEDYAVAIVWRDLSAFRSYAIQLNGQMMVKR